MDSASPFVILWVWIRQNVCGLATKSDTFARAFLKEREILNSRSFRYGDNHHPWNQWVLASFPFSPLWCTIDSQRMK